VRCEQRPGLCDYRLEVRTGGAPGAGTDCHVIVQLFGERPALLAGRLAG
jgi:hypothetical protein